MVTISKQKKGGIDLMVYAPSKKLACPTKQKGDPALRFGQLSPFNELI